MDQLEILPREAHKAENELSLESGKNVRPTSGLHLTLTRGSQFGKQSLENR